MKDIFFPFLVYFVKKRKFIIINFFLCIIFAIVYSFFFAKKQYMASTTFIPMSASKSVFSLAQFQLSDLGSGVEISPDQIKILFESVSLRKEILEKFNYYQKLNLETSPNPLKLGLKALVKDLEYETAEKGSLGVTEILSIKISVFHSSPDTAYLITNFIYKYMDSVITKISTSRATETKNFVNCQLQNAITGLDSLQLELTKFQKENKAYEIPEQIKLTIAAFGELRAKYLTNDIKIITLSKEMPKGSPELELIKKENRILEEKMKILEKDNSSNVLMGFDKYSDLLPKFTNLYREIETQIKMVAFLTQQFEEAKINEAKQISNLVVIDKPIKPQYKERPKRIFLLASIIAVYCSILFAFMSMYYFFVNVVKKSSIYNELISVLSKK